jgi:squalene-hopene/tetraprenyl-beta-curcumene cyclase
LMTAALGGRLGPPEQAWHQVRPLPFELAALPRGTFALLRLPVVSYALPALIAIGHARFFHAPPAGPARWLRAAVSPRTLELLRAIQPASGGYLEATPLTSFVAMALASTGLSDHPVATEAERFLGASQRHDGSWAIDTDLATWGTTLAVKALDGDVPGGDAIARWLLDQQYQTRHPYTDSAAGGWAWTDKPGGVPDGDDTPGALLALATLETSADLVRPAELGCLWLAGLQNRDGGIPTFCRGWGALPFDRSSPDLTAHSLRAWGRWIGDVAPRHRAGIRRVAEKATAYLHKAQARDGSWTPLWFGNDHRSDETNPTYGTAHVCLALAASDPARARGLAWLRAQQNNDGGWGGGEGTRSSIEETALAVQALGLEGTSPALERGIAWLIDRTDNGRVFPPSPIGFYFAKLWYWEKLYPVVWCVAALRQVRQGAST